MNSQQEQVVLVTGAARRIGKTICQHLHEQGFSIAIHCNHSFDDATTLASTLNDKRANSARVFQCALNQPNDSTKSKEHIQSLISDIIKWNPRLYGLVNNASVFIKDTTFDDALNSWQEQFDVNVKAPWLLSHTALSHLQQEQGCIINIGDIHGAKPLKGYDVYSMTKAALLMQTRALALTFAPNVRVNAISPGAIMWPEGNNELSLHQQEKIINKTPLQRHGSPDSIAQAVVSLMANSFITGQTLAVDGGRSLT